MALEDNKRTVERFDAILNTGDLSPLDELCSPDMVNHSLGSSRPAGLEGTREYLGTAGRKFRTEHWQRSFVVAEGDLVMQFGTREGNWPGGQFFGFEVPSGHYTREVAFIYRLAGGRITERWAVRDDLGFLTRLGAMTPQQSVELAR
jgi:ketosteroid isomerase-like protein